MAAFHATYVRYRARTFSYMQCLTDSTRRSTTSPRRAIREAPGSR